MPAASSDLWYVTYLLTCKYLSWRALVLSSSTRAASFRCSEAFCSPSAATTFTGVQTHCVLHRYIQVHALYRYIQVHTGTYRYIQVHTGTCRYMQVHTGTYTVMDCIKPKLEISLLPEPKLSSALTFRSFSAWAELTSKIFVLSDPKSSLDWISHFLLRPCQAKLGFWFYYWTYSSQPNSYLIPDEIQRC